MLSALLIGLLYFSATFPRHSGSVGDHIRTTPHTVEDVLDVQPLTLETQYTLQTLNPSFHWGSSPVPETKIVAHVPGEYNYMMVAV